MVRVPLTESERERGVRLGRVLRAARAGRSMAEVALRAGISVETLRKIETGRIPTPAFFTVAALAEALGLSLDALLREVDAPDTPLVGSSRGRDSAGFSSQEHHSARVSLLPF